MMPSLLPILVKPAVETRAIFLRKWSTLAKSLVLPLILLLSINLELKGQCPPPGSPSTSDSCVQAPLLCTGLEGYCGTLPPNNVQQQFPDCPTNTLNNDEWLSFEASSSTISLLITPTNCQGTNGQFGMQGAIYESCGGMAVATQCECTESPFLLEANLNPGQVYYLVLDGCAGDICDFSVEMLEGSTVCQPIIVGPTSVCLGDTVVYVLNGVGSSANIEWLPIPNASTSINGNNLEVVWNTYSDSSSVCALVTDTNQVIQLLCLHVQINQPFPANVYGPTMPCVGNISVYTALDNEYCNEVPNLFWTVSSGGDLLSSPNPSSIQVQWTDQGLQEVCLHQIFGTDTVTTCLGVNVLPMLHATILVGNPPMPFNADSTLHLCPTDSLNLTALISDSNGNPYPDSAFNFRWLIEGNQFLSGKNLSVKLPAGNCYKVNLDASILLGCQVQDTSLNVEIASIPVAVEIFPAPPICEGESVTLSATTLPYAPLPCEDNPGGDASNNTNLAIPDGDGTSVESVIHVDIPQAGVLAPNQLKAICANLEHSWMRDLEVSLTCPNGQTAILHNHPGQIGGEVYLGIPYQNDEGLPTPFPGTGYPYCWTPDGNQTWIQYANSHPSNYTLPSGNYQSFQPLSIFNGCPINGDWTLTVTDRWAIDNGYLFYWSLDFGYGISGTQNPIINWQPDNSISFYSNDSIVANPTVSTVYTLNVDDGDGCVYDLNYPIEVVPASNLACLPCDSLQAEILGDLIIDCTTTSIDTVSVGTTNLPDSVALYQWTLNGVVVSSTPSVNIQAFGTYIFTVTNALNGCSASDTLVFSQNTDTPIADAGPDFILSCLNPTATLDGSGSSAGPQYQYQWTGPGILDPDVINPIVNEPGVYTLTVINLANGCTATDETLVLQDSGPILPDNPFSIVPDSCHLNTGSISFVYNGPLQLSLLWSTGDTTNTISGLSAGAYGLHILYGNCETNFTIQVDSVGCTGTTEVLAGIQFQVLPNPNSGQFSVLLDVDSPTTLEMELVDVLGRTVSTLQPPKTFGTGQHRLDFQQAWLPSGSYYLMVKTDKGKRGVKVEVVR